MYVCDVLQAESEGRSVDDESYTESDPETMPISQARERIHQLLDEAFSLISPSVAPRNSVAPAPNVTTVQPVQSAPQYAQPAAYMTVSKSQNFTLDFFIFHVLTTVLTMEKHAL